MRYCKDCEHFDMTAAAAGEQPRCLRFAKKVPHGEDPVWGESFHLAAPECKAARGVGGQCGAKGRFYQPRPGTEAWREERARTKEPESSHEFVIVERPESPWWKFW